jgi:erythromycin esterase-like protein
MEPLIPFLTEKAKRGQLVLGGLDDQLGRGTYAVQRKAPDHEASLGQEAKARSLGILQRHLQWRYTSAAPYGPNDKTLILGCLDGIGRTFASRDSAAHEYERAMIQNLARNVGRDLGENTPGVDPETRTFNDRDQSMYLNLQWFMSRLPARSKVIVWTATNHAAKTLRTVPGQEQRVPLGSYIQRDFKNDAFVLGFSAYTGTYALGRQPARALPGAPANSLESRLYEHGGTEPHYLDRGQLQALGTIAARPLGVDFKAVNWTDVLDGLVVFREERPPYPSAP